MSLPIQRILNDPRLETPFSDPSGSEPSSPSSDVHDPAQSSRARHSRAKRSRDLKDLSYTTPTQPIKYGAYEDMGDDASMKLMKPFNIDPLGSIQQWCAHIPYSSDKKDLKAKTGRERFESTYWAGTDGMLPADESAFVVFAYEFTDPDDKEKYAVMWDFRGGYVRISPFFKNRKHKKVCHTKSRELTFVADTRPDCASKDAGRQPRDEGGDDSDHGGQSHCSGYAILGRRINSC